MRWKLLSAPQLLVLVPQMLAPHVFPPNLRLARLPLALQLHEAAACPLRFLRTAATRYFSRA
jgi:hypothetical protein